VRGDTRFRLDFTLDLLKCGNLAQILLSICIHAGASFICVLAPGRLLDEALQVEQLKSDDSISVVIEEDSEPVFSCFTDGFGDMLEPDIEVAFGAEVYGHDFSRQPHVIRSFNLGQDLL